MSKPNNKKRKDEKGDEKEYDPNAIYYQEELEEGVEDTGQEDEEDGEDVEEEGFDVTRLSKTRKDQLKRNNNKVLFLKALSLNCYQDVEKLAKKCGMYHKSDAEGVIAVMMGMITETNKDIDYPERILKYFNNLVPEGYPNKVVLEPQHINELVNLFYVIEEKLANTAKLIDPDKVFGPGPVTDAKTINPVSTQKDNIVMMDNSQQENQTPNQPYQRVDTGSRIPVDSMQQEEIRDIETYASRYAAPDIGLMEMALRRIPNPRPNSIKPFIESFSDLYTDWMANPMKMVEELKFFFGPTHGEHAYRLWKDYRERYMKRLGYAPLPAAGGGMTGEYSPYNFNNNPYQQQNNGGLNPLVMTPAQMEEREWDRKMNKMMKMMEMKLMQSTLEAQQPSQMMYGQNYEEVLDQNGKVIKRIFLNGNGHSNGNSAAELTMVTTLTTLFKEMMSGKNQEMVEILRKVNSPDSMLTDFTKTIMGNFVNNQNPVQQIKEMLDITNMVKNQGPQDNQQKSIEAIKLDIDSKIALQELDMRKMEMRHNWEMDERQGKEQEGNVDKWLNVMLQLSDGIIKPVAMKFVEGLGGANKMPNPFGAMFGGQQPQQPNPYAQQQEAMAQQRHYQQPPPQQSQQPMYQPQPIRNEQPLQPIPRQYNPQQQNMQKPLSQISDQQINSELSQMSPQQIQEIEDKMALDDINREKIKSAILKHKNAKRFTRNPQTPEPTPQQEEARNILFNTPSTKEEELDLDEELGEMEEELSEDEFDEEEDEEESRFMPTTGLAKKKIAPSGEQVPISKNSKQKQFRDFTPESTTETVKRKKLTKQQQAMLAEGQLSPRELANAPDLEIDEDAEKGDEYSYQSIPIAGSNQDASREALIEENLRRQGIKRQGEETPTKKEKKQPSPTTKKTTKAEKYEEEKEQAENIVAEAEEVLDQAELIPEDTFE